MVFLPKNDVFNTHRYQVTQSQAAGKNYKVNDRDRLYVAVTSAGSISFRYNYTINGRQETVTFGRCGSGGLLCWRLETSLVKQKRCLLQVSQP